MYNKLWALNRAALSGRKADFEALLSAGANVVQFPDHTHHTGGQEDDEVEDEQG